MKNALKKHFNTRIISLLVLFITLLTSCSRGLETKSLETKIEENPAHIETIIGVELPELELVNSERGVGSRYISYTYEFKFREPISEVHTTQLEELCRTDKHWSRNFRGDYIYDATNINGDIVDCLISNDHLIFGYSQSDGEEEIADFIIVLAIITIIIKLIAIIAGIVAFIIFLVRKFKK